MAKNYVQPGDVLDHVCAAARTSGVAFVLGTRLAVPLTSGAIGATISVRVSGVFTLPKLSTDVVAQGAALYWDGTNNRLTTTSAGNTYAGYAAAASGNGVATVDIKLND